jgi:LPXTG-motif cell wall-anchored protein
VTERTESQGGMRRHARATGVLLTCWVLAAVLFLTAIPTAWATPGESPQNQTIPTPEPTNEKEKEGPSRPAPTPVGSPGQTFDVRLGPGDGMFNLPMPGAGCIQLNVFGLPWQALFQITPMLPDTAPAPPAGCYRTTAAYTLKVWNTQTGQPLDVIAPDYKHTICYTDADLVAAKGDPNKFVIAYYDEGQQSWQQLDPTEIDPVNRHVTAPTGHASWWALFACDAEKPLTLPETGHAPSQVPALAVAGLLLLGTGGWLALRLRRQA